MPLSVGEQNVAPAAKMPRDAELGQMLEHTAKEAQEQMVYHRSELAMWERVSAAAHAALGMLSGELELADAEQAPAPMKKRGW